MHLVCRFDGYDNERSLVLHRMLSASATPFTFERPKDFNFKQYDDDGRFGYGDGKLIRLSFSIEKEAGYHLLESPLSEDQQVVELDNAYQITATVVDSAMLEWWLRGVGEDIWNVQQKNI